MAGCFAGGICTGAALDSVICFSCGKLAPKVAHAPLALMAVYRSVITVWPLRQAGIKAKEGGANDALARLTKQATLLGVCVSPVFVTASLKLAWKGVLFGRDKSKPVLKKILRIR